MEAVSVLGLMLRCLFDLEAETANYQKVVLRDVDG